VTEDGEATSTTQEPAAAAAARAHELEEVGPTSATRRLESWRRFLSAIYSAPDCEAEYCDERVRLSVCVCLSAIVSSELHVRSSPNFICALPVAVARSSSAVTSNTTDLKVFQGLDLSRRVFSACATRISCSCLATAAPADENASSTTSFISIDIVYGSRVVSALDSGAEGRAGSNRSRDAVG